MPKGADALVDSLVAQGVEYVFGVCGDTSIDLYQTFSEENDLKHILARDERHAAYMADAYGRLSEKPGVCEGPSGGGATYLIPGLAESSGSSIPVVAMNTTIPVQYRNRGVLTEIDQEDLFDTVTKWNASVDHPDLIPRMVRQAFRHATTDKPGASHLSFPMNVLNEPTEEAVYPAEEATTCPAYRNTPDSGKVQQSIELIEKSEYPVLVIGGGIHTSIAWDEVLKFAETAEIPVASSLTAAGAIGDSPYYIGVIGENGYREYANEIIRDSDLVIMGGTAVESVWTDKWSRPADQEKPIIHIDVDAPSIGKNYKTEVRIHADLRESIKALTSQLTSTTSWDTDDLQDRYSEWLAPYKEKFDSDEFPLRPERIVHDTSRIVPDNTVFVSDAGTTTPYFASMYPFPELGCHWVPNRAHGALGYALPAAVGAHFADQSANIVALSGDGSFGISVGELETYRRFNLPITLVVINNGSFSWIEAGQRNYDDFSFGVDFEELNYASIAESFGLKGLRVDSASEYADALEEAIAFNGPSVIDVPTKEIAAIDNVPVSWLEPNE